MIKGEGHDNLGAGGNMDDFVSFLTSHLND